MQSGTGWLYTLSLGGLAISLVAFALVNAVDLWRRWSEYRRTDD
jgi:hypothetical protein